MDSTGWAVFKISLHLPTLGIGLNLPSHSELFYARLYIQNQLTLAFTLRIDLHSPNQAHRVLPRPGAKVAPLLMTARLMF